MTEIQPLPAHVVNQIAAGEVVERPASVLKELLENALDAGAQRVEVEVEDGGRGLVRVRDDGAGMTREDLAVCLEPHATSKLREAEDLFRVSSFGFRGEALPSIGSVSRLRILTRAAGEEEGHELSCEGGVHGELRVAGAPPGTTVEVRSLFFNTPARKKWMKTASTELGRLTEAMTRQALAHYHVHFTFTHNGKRLYDLPCAGDHRERIGFFFGRELAGRLLDIESQGEDVALHGLIGPPRDSRPNAGMGFLFVNDRYVRDKVVTHAAMQAYSEYLPPRRWPVTFLFLIIDPALVDVNVHPTKIEVRFRHQHDIHDLVRRAIGDRLRRARLAKEIDPPEPTGVESLRFDVQEGGRFIDAASDADRRESAEQEPEAQRRHETGKAIDQFFNAAPRKSLVPAPLRATSPPPGGELTVDDRPAPIGVPGAPGEQPAASCAGPWRSRFFQAHDRYIVYETSDGLAIVDQHALHERVRYHQIRSRLERSGLERQKLLVPHVFDLGPGAVELLLGHGPELETLGFEIGDMGGGTLAVYSVPVLARDLNVADFFEDYLAGVRAGLVGAGKGKGPRHIEAAIDMMACKSAVRAGQPLSQEAIAAILEESRHVDTSYACPHGRPTTLTLTIEQLDRHFDRH